MDATTAPRRRSSRLRGLFLGIALTAAAVLVAATAAGGTYAAWSKTVTVPGATLSTGSIGLTVNDVQQYSVPGMTDIPLLPGRSVVSTTPITARNTGSVPLRVTVGALTVPVCDVLGQNILVGVRTIAAGQSCTVTASGIPASSQPFSLAPGATAALCVEVALKADAPATVQGRMVDFGVALVGDQVRP